MTALKHYGELGRASWQSTQGSQFPRLGRAHTRSLLKASLSHGAGDEPQPQVSTVGARGIDALVDEATQ